MCLEFKDRHAFWYEEKVQITINITNHSPLMARVCHGMSLLWAAIECMCLRGIFCLVTISSQEGNSGPAEVNSPSYVRV